MKILWRKFTLMLAPSKKIIGSEQSKTTLEILVTMLAELMLACQIFGTRTKTGFLTSSCSVPLPSQFLKVRPQ